MESQRRWFIQFLESITIPQWFFLGFGAITFLFIRLMYSHYQKGEASKFKETGGGSTAIRKTSSQEIKKKN